MRIIAITLIATSLLSSATWAADQSDNTSRSFLSANAAYPHHNTADHNTGDMAMAVTNRGTFGTGYALNYTDCFTGLPLHSCEFPKGSATQYLYAGTLWIGGIVGQDTLVSTGFDGWNGAQELNPDVAPAGAMRYRSTLSTGNARFDAVSHQDFITSYWDTCAAGCLGLQNDAIDRRPHRPLNIRVDQRSYAWSGEVIQDVVFFDLTITNIGTATINEGYVGIHVDADVFGSNTQFGHTDDVTGFIDSVSDRSKPCPVNRSVPTAWIADNDGDLLSSSRVAHVTATALLNLPGENARVSYNWWAANGVASLDFGPMRQVNTRDFGTGGTGTPSGDRNKYWMLGNGDIDYDQVYIAGIRPGDTTWQLPNQSVARSVVYGYDTRYVLSVGPFDLQPGQSVPLAFAYIGGRDFHIDPTNFSHLPDFPDAYTSHLDFTDLKRKALWASWVYDNPGVDTDSDWYAGRYVLCGSDTSWIEGDGVPDYRAAAPPVRPEMSATPQSGAVRIRWNGARSESSRDFLTSSPDFEGYKVYLRKVNDSATWQTVAAYDIDDYFIAIYDFLHQQWTVHPSPSTIEVLRCLRAPGGCDDSLWSPLNHSRSNPYVKPNFPDSIFYWVPVGCNTHWLGHETPILKTYPDAPRPRWPKVSDVPADSLALYLTDDGKFKYYEYELTITDLTPADSYLVSVTALDFGRASLTAYTPLETPVEDGAVIVVPLSTPNCCAGITGNVDCDPNGAVDIADLSVMIDHMFISFTPLCCGAEANTDGDPEGVVDISDLSRLIDFLYINLAPLSACE